MFRFLLRKLFLATVTSCIIFLVLYTYYVWKELPSAQELREVRLQEPLRIYSKDGKLIGEYGEKKRIPININQVPKRFINAFLATEDIRFYEHNGVDLRGLGRAVFNLLLTGRKEQGGSTITMQVARNFFLSPHKTFIRKLNEIILAFDIEQKLSKNEILELYLNKIFLGQRSYGIAAAAKTYYGKDIDQLTLAQMAMIAGIPKAPSILNPLANQEKAIARRNHVLERMLYYNLISEVEYNDAINKDLTAKHHGTKMELEAPYVAEMIRSTLEKKFGSDAYTQGFNVYATINSDLQNYANHAVYDALDSYDKRHGYRGALTTLPPITAENSEEWIKTLNTYADAGNKKAAAITYVGHNKAKAVLKNHTIIELPWPTTNWQKKFISAKKTAPFPQNINNVLQVGDVIYVERDSDGSYKIAQRPEIEGSLIALNPHNGDILALVGGYDYDYSQFNRVVNLKRQSGSAFKPFIYSAALDKGYTPATLVNDAPILIKGAANEDDWRPQNHNYKFNGLTTFRNGLVNSRNLVSIRILEDISVNYTVEFLKNFGFNQQELPQSLSLALGTSSNTPLELARAYAVFANGGYLVYPNVIDKITIENKIIYEKPLINLCDECSYDFTDNQFDLQAPERTLSKQNAYLTTDILKDVILKGTARKAKVLKRRDLAGKTGSTNDNKDAWFAGFSPDLVVITWVGFDSPQTIGEYASTSALPMWIDFMKNALFNTPEQEFAMPEGLTLSEENENLELANTAPIEESFSVEEVLDGAQASSNTPAAPPKAVHIEDVF